MRASHRRGGGAPAAASAAAVAAAPAAAADSADSAACPSAKATPRKTETPLLNPAEALFSPATRCSLLPPASASTSRALG